jgi:hypothetical protein
MFVELFQQDLPPPPEFEEPKVESAWERGLRHAKEVSSLPVCVEIYRVLTCGNRSVVSGTLVHVLKRHGHS